jgi:hypothetical protein
MCFNINDNNDYINDSSSTDYNSPTESHDDTSIIIDLYGEGHFNSPTESTDDTSIIIGDSDSDSDFGFEFDYDSINVEDSLHFYNEKINKQYYIGLCHTYYIHNISYILLSTSVSAPIFFKHSYDNINNYLYYYGLVRIPSHQVQIMQVHILEDETCTVIIKTYWLRIIQRHWKQIYKQRNYVIQQRSLPQNQLYKEIHGKYPQTILKLPSLHGMLSIYHNTNEQS